MRIDFISDVVCPWCAIGLWSLAQALERTGITASLRMQPFELNPDMPHGGEDLTDHLTRKYGRSALELSKTHAMIGARGAEVGFAFDWDKRTRIYNTFDAHRLIHWAGLTGRDLALERALMRGYHGEGRDISDVETLVAIASEAKLDPAGARAVLEAGDYGDEVREREQYYLDLEISGVPAVIIDGQHLISGAQPSSVYEAALRQLKAS